MTVPAAPNPRKPRSARNERNWRWAPALDDTALGHDPESLIRRACPSCRSLLPPLAVAMPGFKYFGDHGVVRAWLPAGGAGADISGRYVAMHVVDLEGDRAAGRCNPAAACPAATAPRSSPLPSVSISDHVVFPTFCGPPSPLPALYPARRAISKQFFPDLFEGVTRGPNCWHCLSGGPSAGAPPWSAAARLRFNSARSVPVVQPPAFETPKLAEQGKRRQATGLQNTASLAEKPSMPVPPTQ